MKRQQLAPGVAERYEKPLDLEEYARIRAIPRTEDEVAETLELVRWFRRRYPTAQERFAYVRRKYAEWTRNPPARIGRGPGELADIDAGVPGAIDAPPKE